MPKVGFELRTIHQRQRICSLWFLKPRFFRVKTDPTVVSLVSLMTCPPVDPSTHPQLPHPCLSLFRHLTAQRKGNFHSRGHCHKLPWKPRKWLKKLTFSPLAIKDRRSADQLLKTWFRVLGISCPLCLWFSCAYLWRCWVGDKDLPLALRNGWYYRQSYF